MEHLFCSPLPRVLSEPTLRLKDSAAWVVFKYWSGLARSAEITPLCFSTARLRWLLSCMAVSCQSFQLSSWAHRTNIKLQLPCTFPRCCSYFLYPLLSQNTAGVFHQVVSPFMLLNTWKTNTKAALCICFFHFRLSCHLLKKIRNKNI